MELVLIITSYLTSAFAAVVGMGGGIMLLSVMLLFLPLEITIPLHGAVQLVSNFTRLILFYKYIQFRVFIIFSVAATVGTIPGIYLFNSLDKLVIKILLGLFIVYSVLRPTSTDAHHENSIPTSVFEKIYNLLLSSNSFLVAGFLAGSVSMIIGATGPLIGPFFLRAKFEKNVHIATLAVCQSYVHFLKLLAFGFIGMSIFEEKFLFLTMSAGVILGTITGKRIISLIPEETFHKIFKIVLGIIGAKILIIDGLYHYISPP